MLDELAKLMTGIVLWLLSAALVGLLLRCAGTVQSTAQESVSRAEPTSLNANRGERRIAGGVPDATHAIPEVRPKAERRDTNP